LDRKKWGNAVSSEEYEDQRGEPDWYGFLKPRVRWPLAETPEFIVKNLLKQ
jgi:hypothetical protein